MDSIRPVEPAPDRPTGFLEDGHVWIREYVTGSVLTVRMADSGLLEWRREAGAFEEPPWPYRPAVSALRDSLDRDRFRASVEDVTDYEFSVLVPLSMGVDYDWDRTPPILGRAIRNRAEGAVLPVDVAERAFEALGVETVPVLERERPVRDLSIEGLSIPGSRFSAGQAAGVVVQKKRGDQVAVLRDGVGPISRRPPEPAGSPEDLASWLHEAVDRERVQSLLQSDRSVAARDLESLVETVGGELGRRGFDAVGGAALERPSEYRSTVRDRLVAIRSPSTGSTE